jgi:hypothetical protein
LFPDRLTVVAQTESIPVAAAIVQAANRAVGAPANLAGLTWDTAAERLLELYARLLPGRAPLLGKAV